MMVLFIYIYVVVMVFTRSLIKVVLHNVVMM